MSAGELNLHINQGSTYRKTLTWTDSTGAAVNLTGYTARMQVREEIGGSVALLELTTENGGITLGGAAGTIELYVSDTVTAAFDWGAGVYDLELIAGGGDVTRLVEGKVKVSFEVTR